MNTSQASRRMHSRHATATLPIVALIAYTLSHERVRYFQITRNDYEPKPFEFARLLRKIALLSPVARNQHSGDA